MSAVARGLRLILIVVVGVLLLLRLLYDGPAWLAVNAGARAWRDASPSGAAGAAAATTIFLAGSAFMHATRLQPASLSAWRGLGRLQLWAGQADRAAVSLQQAALRNPADRLSHLELARAFTQLGNADAARAQWQLAGWPAYLSLRRQAQDALDNGQPAAAAGAARLAISVAPAQPQAHYLLGEAAWALGDREAAAAAWREGTAQVGGPPAAIDLYYRGRLALLDRQAAVATADLQAALTLDSELPWGQFWLGEALFAKGDTQAASAAFRQHVTRYPANPWGYVRLGDMARVQGRLEEAASWYRRGLAVDPGNQAARQGLAALNPPASSDN